MSFLDEILKKSPIKPVVPMPPIGPAVGLFKAATGPNARAFTRSMLPGMGEARVTGDVIGQLLGSGKDFATDASRITGAPTRFLYNSPLNVTRPLIRSLPRAAMNAGQAITDAVQGTQAAEAPTDRTTAWDTDAQYAVMRNLTEADRTVPFQNATNSQQVTNKTSAIVLKYLAQEGVTIAPEVAKAFTEGADEAIRLWYNGSMQDEQNVDISEYYKFMTDAVLEAQRSFEQDQPEETTSTAPPAEGLTSTEAAMATGNQQQTAPAGAAPDTAMDWGFMEATDEAQMMPDEDMMAWDGSYWGSGQGGNFDNQSMYNAYIGWLQGTAQPSWNKTPEAFMKYAEALAKRNRERGTT
jgi:hypothetical protein